MNKFASVLAAIAELGFRFSPQQILERQQFGRHPLGIDLVATCAYVPVQQHDAADIHFRLPFDDVQQFLPLFFVFGGFFRFIAAAAPAQWTCERKSAVLAVVVPIHRFVFAFRAESTPSGVDLRRSVLHHFGRSLGKLIRRHRVNYAEFSGPTAMPAGVHPILLIGEDNPARRELAVKLDFLGESAATAAPADWWRSASDAVQVVFFGDYGTADRQQLLAELGAGLPRAAIVLLEEGAIPETATADLRARLFAEADAGANFRNLLDVLHKARLCHANLAAAGEIDAALGVAAGKGLIGASPAIARVRDILTKLAGTEVNVLITGESGTGKEIVARNLHHISARSSGPFVPVNCGAIPGELLESELFGHERGAFTGAVASTVGRFERAHRGTLFLDEIGDMPLNMQVKLLRVLEEGSFEKVGGIRSVSADVRVLTATHKNLEEMIAAGQFREDLYYRINVFPIEMPPLRERLEDIPPLMNELIRNLEAAGKGSVRFNSAAVDAIRGYAWPGNVRELANFIERMAIMHPHGIVGFGQLPDRFRTPRAAAQSGLAQSSAGRRRESLELGGEPAAEYPRVAAASAGAMPPVQGLDLKQYLANLERDIIEQALRDSGGVVAKAAKRLRLQRTTLVEKMRRHGLGREQ